MLENDKMLAGRAAELQSLRSQLELQQQQQQQMLENEKVLTERVAELQSLRSQLRMQQQQQMLENDILLDGRLAELQSLRIQQQQQQEQLISKLEKQLTSAKEIQMASEHLLNEMEQKIHLQVSSDDLP